MYLWKHACVCASPCICTWSICTHVLHISTDQNTISFVHLFCSFLCAPSYMCLCTWAGVFVHSLPSRTMNNKLYFDVPHRWTLESAPFDFLPFWHGCQSASVIGWNQSCCPQRILSHPFSLPPLPSLLLSSGQVNLFHMTVKRGLLQTLTAHVKIHPEKYSVLSRRHNHIPLIIWCL